MRLAVGGGWWVVGLWGLFGGGGRVREWEWEWEWGFTRPKDSPIIKTKFCSAIMRGFVINR